MLAKSLSDLIGFLWRELGTAVPHFSCAKSAGRAACAASRAYTLTRGGAPLRHDQHSISCFYDDFENPG
jgi:hypothetical protein